VCVLNWLLVLVHGQQCGLMPVGQVSHQCGVVATLSTCLTLVGACIMHGGCASPLRGTYLVVSAVIVFCKRVECTNSRRAQRMMPQWAPVLIYFIPSRLPKGPEPHQECSVR
jgi:hypothetical protein